MSGEAGESPEYDYPRTNSGPLCRADESGYLDSTDVFCPFLSGPRLHVPERLLVGHDTAARFLRQPAGDKAACVLCQYEAEPTEERRQRVIAALGSPS